MTVYEELYGRIHEIVGLKGDGEKGVVNKMMHEALAIVCAEGLKGSNMAYGNLFSQVETLCKQHGVKTSDRVAIHTMRRHSNHAETLDWAETLYDLRALSRFISAVSGIPEPGSLLQELPADRRPYVAREGLDVKYIRCIVRFVDSDCVYAVAEKGLDGQLLAVDLSAEDVAYVLGLSKEGTQLNVLDGKVMPRETRQMPNGEVAEVVVVPGMVVVEPDYLIDISSIAACFKEHGHHPLSYTLDRMKPRTDTQAILLGNFAGSALDDVINKGDRFCFAETMRSNFKEKALEYCSCPDFDAKAFVDKARAQADNIRKAVDVMFENHDRKSAILEPSFVCERLGLQGRVDLMTTDFSLLVEQKSGRNLNVERGRVGGHGSMHVEQHYVQLLLYYGVLKYNFNLGHDKTDIRLLYSKYPPNQGLMDVAFYRKLFMEAIKVRNEIVATDFLIAHDGFAVVLPYLTVDTLNTSGTASSFFTRWVLPGIEGITLPLQSMPQLEKEYFCRMMTFVCQEQVLAKVGAQEGIGNCAADLWNMPVSEKLETGNIYVGLEVVAKERSTVGGAYDKVTLSVPMQGDGCMPNFRRGDMVYLYSYCEGAQPDALHSILYKGSLAEIRTGSITVVLSDGQQNHEILKVENGESGAEERKGRLLYAVEHAGSDANSGAAVRGLHELITAPDARRGLILGYEPPRRDPLARLSHSYNADYDDVLLRAKQAQDYFLMIGPPGTGKTSMAIRLMVEEELLEPQASILLMAYTNRAVDELCAMLEDDGIGYVRIGNEYSSDRRFRSRLLGEAVGTHPKLDEMKGLLVSSRVVVCTTSMLASKPFLFNIKDFSLAIVDEASQITEPNIVGLLSAHRHGGHQSACCNISKFVLVGDYKQLPAVVRQDERSSSVNSQQLLDICLDNCRNSLFERLLRVERKNGREDFIGVLHKQGRMHPDVAEFPDEMFYREEAIEPVPLPHQRETKLDYQPTALSDGIDSVLRSHRLIFIPSKTCRKPAVSDKVNVDEARIVADLLLRIREMIGDRFNPIKSVGVIVPYRNQIALIRSEIEKLGVDGLDMVSIDTVERYQGSQRDVIIYSFTVQNFYQIGFLAANCFMENGRVIDRKLNVAMTRARRQMIVTGNERIMESNPVFAHLIEYIREKGGVVAEATASSI